VTTSKWERATPLIFGIGDLHRIENIGSNDVIFIEVQTGTYFGEDDIERIEDDFGR
jgi:mannose-6-phosphate isomerase